MRGKHKRLTDRASPCPLPLLMVASLDLDGRAEWGVGARRGSSHTPGSDHFLKGSKILFEGLFCFLFVNIQASGCLGEREVVFDGTRLGS